MIINYIGINQNKTLISLGKNDVFSIIGVYKNNLIVEKKTQEIHIVEIYYNTNIIFIVGDNNLLNTLNIYDDLKKKYIANIKIQNKIESIKINKKYIILSDSNYIYIYNFTNLSYLNKFKFKNKSNNLFDLSNNNFLVYSNNNGYINIYNCDTHNNKLIKNHDNNIQFIKVSNNNKYIASVSINGNVIKLYDYEKNKIIKLFYRGFYNSTINSLEFDKNDNYLFCYSEYTIHIFSINKKNPSLLYFDIWNYEKNLYQINLKTNNNIIIITDYNQIDVINKNNLKKDKYLLVNDYYEIN